MDVQPVDEHEEATKEVDDRALWALVKQLQKLLPLMERIADRLDEQSKQTAFTWIDAVDVGWARGQDMNSTIVVTAKQSKASGMIYLPLGEGRSE